MLVGVIREYFNVITGLCIVLILGGCATSNKSYKHPFDDDLFQAPELNIEEYKSVHDRPNNQKDLSVIVAISGGGERAGNFGVGSLIELEQILIKNDAENALQEVDYFSTVSGGGMAVAAYLSAKYSYVNSSSSLRGGFSFGDAISVSIDDLKRQCKKRNVSAYYETVDRNVQITDPCLRRHLSRGYHNNIIAAFFNRRIILTKFDRGDLLEEAFSNELLGGQWNSHDLVLADLFVPVNSKEDQWYPHWITNATVVENGAIFPFTPALLAKYQVTKYVHRVRDEKKEKESSYREFSNDVPLSLGLSASGNFPSLITPQTMSVDLGMPENGYLHLIDGGMSDNLGITTASSIFNQKSEEDNRKVLIVIDAYKGSFSPYSKSEGAPNALQIYLKLADMPLDGNRSRVNQTLRQLESNTGASVIYISFDDLYRPKASNPYQEDNDAVQKLFEELKNYYVMTEDEAFGKSISMQSLNEGKTPYEIARKIATNYNITRSEQRYLIAIGRYLVSKRADEIRSAMSLK